MTEKRMLVHTENLTKIYGDGVEVRALDSVNLAVEEGEMIAVMGPSGSGKSTLLNMLGALDVPTSGTVFIDGQDLSRIKNVDRFRSQMVGFVFQMHNLIPTLTALENVEVPLRGQRVSSRKRQERAAEMLALVGLSGREKHLPGQLSGGERQRVAIARALVNDPAIILADEPTGNLDSDSGNEVVQLLVTLNREHNATILLVTHDRRVARATQRVLNMDDGKIVDEHVVLDSLSEDLWDWAHCDLGQLLVAGDIDALASSPLVSAGKLTATGEQLARLLAPLS
jgi:ABC-type lipoprotein export system ATPase subunit